MFGSYEPCSESYIEYERRLRHLHALIRDGAGDSDEAEALRDDMDVFWYRLSPEETKTLETISTELNLRFSNESEAGNDGT
jgi:hypothetical protein